MGSMVAIKSKSEAAKVLSQHYELVDQNNVRQTVQNALIKLNEVKGRIELIESKGFFKRMVGGITGSNQKEMVAAIRDISDAQNMTIQLVLSLAIMHSQNQHTLDVILDELDRSRGTYTRIIDHIEFLYNQVKNVKESQENTPPALSNTNKSFKNAYVFLIIGIIIGLLVVINQF
jgi:hypothetical protein